MDINKEVIFDYVSATLPERLIGNQREQDKAYELRNVFKNFFKLHDCQIKELDYATNNFKYEFVYSDFITLRCGGPYNDSGFRTCQLELKGEGCREFERLRPDLKWKDFFYFLIGLDARFKRIDMKKFMRNHEGFSRDNIQDWMNLISFIINEPENRYDKLKLFLKMAISTPKKVRFRDVMSKKVDTKPFSINPVQIRNFFKKMPKLVTKHKLELN